MLRRSNPTSKHLEGVAQQCGQAGKEFAATTMTRKMVVVPRPVRTAYFRRTAK